MLLLLLLEFLLDLHAAGRRVPLCAVGHFVVVVDAAAAAAAAAAARCGRRRCGGRRRGGGGGGGGCRHLVAQQADVFDGFQLDRIAEELVAVAFSLDLAEDVDAVVVAQGPGHLVVVHRRMILLDAPEPGQSRRIRDLEHARFAVLPGDVVRVALTGVVEQLLQKVPQQSAVGARVQPFAGTVPAARSWPSSRLFAVQRHRRHGRSWQR